MFICNIKLNGNKLFRWILVLLFVIILVICSISIYRIFVKDSSLFTQDEMHSPNLVELNASNYTNILKSVHDHLDEHIGENIKFTGYVYRAFDFNESEFVLARDMVINSDFQTLIVGFLCHSDIAHQFSDGTWVSITGQITKGYYHGDIPVIDIKEIQETSAPTDEYVYPPDEDYVPTSALF